MRRNVALLVVGVIALALALPLSVVVLILVTGNIAGALLGTLVIFVGLMTMLVRVAPRLLGELLDAQDRSRNPPEDLPD